MVRQNPAGWAHPRSRGEHGSNDTCTCRRWGSSPLARGAPPTREPEWSSERLIPARAGSTTPASPSSAPRRAHPRSRGEHMIARIGAGTRRGSSPLARGAPSPVRAVHPSPRLIPARAGSTAPEDGVIVYIAAHPRSRGEHDDDGVTFQGVPGSSPLARGALEVGRCAAGVDRLIPARAGSTRHRGPGRQGTRAHPRSRGEHERTR